MALTDQASADTALPSDGIDEIGPTYPEGAVGELMRQRESALASAENARAQAQQFSALAAMQDTRAAALQTAIDALTA
jgi:hypothetical protein